MTISGVKSGSGPCHCLVLSLMVWGAGIVAVHLHFWFLAGAGTASSLQSRGKVLMHYFQPGSKAEVQPVSSHSGTWALSPPEPRESHPHVRDPEAPTTTLCGCR